LSKLKDTNNENISGQVEMSAVLQTNSDFNIEPGTPLVCSIPDIDGKFVIGIYTGMKDDQYFGTMFNDVD
jgi:hypothetical protein